MKWCQRWIRVTRKVPVQFSVPVYQRSFSLLIEWRPGSWHHTWRIMVYRRPFMVRGFKPISSAKWTFNWRDGFGWIYRPRTP